MVMSGVSCPQHCNRLVLLLDHQSVSPPTTTATTRTVLITSTHGQSQSVKRYRVFVPMEFRRRARLFERKSSFLERLRKKRNDTDCSVMKVKTKTGRIKELNSNGVEIVPAESEARYQDNSRKHRQVERQRERERAEY